MLFGQYYNGALVSIELKNESPINTQKTHLASDADVDILIEKLEKGFGVEYELYVYNSYSTPFR